MPVPIERIRDWANGVGIRQIFNGAAYFMGKPDDWYENPHWFCGNGHVSARYLSRDSGPHCLACGLPVAIGPAVGEKQFAPILALLAFEPTRAILMSETNKDRSGKHGSETE